MATEAGELAGEVGVDVQHAIIVMAEESHAVVGHGVRDAGGFDPFVEFGPDGIVVQERAGDLVKIDAGALEGVRDLGNRAGGAPGEPVASHFRAIAKVVECLVVDGLAGLEVHDHDRNLGALSHRKHGGGKRVSGDIEENDVHLRAPEETPGLGGALRRIHQTRVADFDSGASEFVRDLGDISLEAFLEALELRPVGLEADAKKSDAKGAGGIHIF